MHSTESLMLLLAGSLSVCSLPCWRMDDKSLKIKVMFQQITFTLPYLQWASVCISRNGKKLVCMEKLNLKASHWYALIYTLCLAVLYNLFLVLFSCFPISLSSVFPVVWMHTKTVCLHLCTCQHCTSCFILYPFPPFLSLTFPTPSNLCNYIQSFPFLVVRVSYFLCICHHSFSSCSFIVLVVPV